MMNPSFDERFKILTGRPPFPWQAALYERFLADREDNIPHAADIPTGLGKTSVIAVWLLALIEKPEKMPRRLVYVVNRRTVVDQTTAEVQRLRERLPKLDQLGFDDLAISTLRGQFADNQEWQEDPSRSAIICGTVDMIGSRLLFEGYRVGFKSRPLHAGFLGQDALLVHDEAHLEPAFQQLIEKIQSEQTQERNRGGDLPWPGLRAMALSATVRDAADKSEPGARTSFDLTEKEKQPPEHLPKPPTQPIQLVWRRLKAPKSLQLHSCDQGKELPQKIAGLAVEHEGDDTAVLIFVRKVDDMTNIIKELAGKKKCNIASNHIETLTGTMRGFERDKLVQSNPIFARYFPPSDRPQDVTPAEGTVYLVCTSAGEVGVNLSADHMVCDLSTFDSMAQRLGRVNRFGDRDNTKIDVVHPAESGEKDSKSTKTELDERRKKTLVLLQQLNGDASPTSLNTLPANQRIAAFAPEPKILPATDILFDSWALTSIKADMPGRPPVAPYLHGVADERRQTTLAWRTELDLVDTESSMGNTALRRIFDKHPIKPHETLTTNSSRVSEFLKKLKNRPELHDTCIAILFTRSLRIATVDELIDDPSPLYAEPTLILPASFGGLDDKGALSADAVRTEKSPQVETGGGDVDGPEQTEDTAGKPTVTPDIADNAGYEPYEGAQSRIRVLIVRTDTGWRVRNLPGGKSIPSDWVLEPAYETSTALVNVIREQSGLAVRLVQALKKNEEGEDVCSLTCFSPTPPTQQREEQSLADHVGLVEGQAKHIAGNLCLPEPYRTALLFAAKWHDEGKKAPIWQRYIGGPDGRGQCLGKSAKWRDPRLLAGYRHEFGSLLRLEHPGNSETSCTLPENEHAKQLALHMIASHHGYARPHFAHTIDHDFTATQSEATHIEVMRRYARLQRRYGRWGLAYLESLLRAADATASRAVGLDSETDDTPEEADS